jgi:hypothetical protein
MIINKQHQFLASLIILFIVFATAIRAKLPTLVIAPENNTHFLQYFIYPFIAIALLSGLIFFRSWSSLKSTSDLKSILVFVLFAGTLLYKPLMMQAMVLFIAICAVYALITKSKPQIHQFYFFILIYIGYEVIGMLWSINREAGLHLLNKNIVLLLIPIAFGCLNIKADQKKLTMLILFRFCMIFVFAGLLSYLFQVTYVHESLLAGLKLNKNYLNIVLPNLTHYDLLLYWAYYTHPTFISFILSMTAIFGFYLYDDKSVVNNISIPELIVYIVSTMLLIIFLQSRLGMILFTLSTITGIIWSVRNHKKTFWAMLSALFISTVAGGALVLKYKSDYFFDEPRYRMFFRTMSYIKEHLLWGTGTGGMRNIIVEFANPHNQFYGEVLHLGIFGGAILVLMIGMLGYYSFREKSFLLIVFFASYCLLMMVEMPLQVQKGINYFAYFAFFLLPTDKKTKHSRINSQS